MISISRIFDRLTMIHSPDFTRLWVRNPVLLCLHAILTGIPRPSRVRDSILRQRQIITSISPSCESSRIMQSQEPELPVGLIMAAYRSSSEINRDCANARWSNGAGLYNCATSGSLADAKAQIATRLLRPPALRTQLTAPCWKR